jgi:hypothetical protein
MKQTSESEKKKLEKSCLTCTHHNPTSKSINDAPPFCWDCVAFKIIHLPYWEPKDGI